MLKKLIFIIALTLLWILGSAQPSGRDQAGDSTQKPLLIKHVRIFDGHKVIRADSVLVQRGRIAAVGRDLPAPADAEAIDGSGKTLLPGLIDAHVHAFSEQSLRQALVFGVTAVVDMFTEIRFMTAVKEKQKSGQAPDFAYLVSSGTLATAPGGHGTEYGIPIATLTRPDEAQAWVDARIGEGSDFIKIILDDGKNYNIALPTLDMPVVAALIAAAHRREKIAVIHAATLKNCCDALQAGVDGLAHLYFDGASDPGFGRLAAQKRAFVIPTLSVIEAAGNRGDADVSHDARLTPYLRPGDLRGLNSRSHLNSVAVPWELRQRAIRQLQAAKVPILAGTDAPNPGTVFGASLHHELALLVAAGLTPQEALQAATALPAERFRIADRGRIRPGACADLLLVNGDPLEEIDATRDIVAVWHDGIRVERERYRADVEKERAEIERLKSVPPPKGSETGLISDFEGDKVASLFGAGWMGSSDSIRGGKSRAEYKLVKGGANGSSGALQISGTIVDAGAMSWAGAMFSPGANYMAPTNLSAFPGLSFWAKGDGRQYAVMIFARSLGYTPAVRRFTAGPEWKENNFTFKDFGVEAYDVMAIFIGASGNRGEFTLLIDDIRLR